MRKQTKNITLRITEEEYKLLKARVERSGMKQADFLRVAIFHEKIYSLVGVDKIITELKYIGNNVNQIAKKLNCGYDIKLSEFTELTEELKNIWQLLRQSIQRQA